RCEGKNRATTTNLRQPEAEKQQNEKETRSLAKPEQSTELRDAVNWTTGKTIESKAIETDMKQAESRKVKVSNESEQRLERQWKIRHL
ncbi:hypothetical protein A2U01_0083228, partial [Trifolium medium]|nr:hypothetical protein [Trifolium medium]